MKLERILMLGALALALLITGCAEESEEDEEVKPVDITVGVAIGEPDTPTDPAIEPAVAYDSTRIHLVYCQDDGTGVHDIVYTQRLGGGSFTTPAPVFPGSAGDSRNPHVFLDASGTLHMVWEEGTSPNREIYYATRDSGGTLSTPSNLSSNTEDDADPRVHVDSGGKIHVVWTGSTAPPNPTTSIFYRRTQGTLFLATVELPKVPSLQQPAETPDITTDPGNRVYVVWAESDGSSRNIRMVRSDDGGQNFGSVSDYAVSGGVDMTTPRIEAGLDGEIFLAFTGQDTGGDRALYATFTRTGGTFVSPGILLTSDTGGIRDPEIGVFRRPDDNFTVMIVCNDGPTAGGNIVGFASHDNGENYPGDPVNFSQGNTQPATNKFPVVALDDNEVIVSWQAEPQGGGVVRTWTSSNDYSLP
jgi:hypothetical protein